MDVGGIRLLHRLIVFEGIVRREVGEMDCLKIESWTVDACKEVWYGSIESRETLI